MDPISRAMLRYACEGGYESPGYVDWDSKARQYGYGGWGIKINRRGWKQVSDCARVREEQAKSLLQEHIASVKIPKGSSKTTLLIPVSRKLHLVEACYKGFRQYATSLGVKVRREEATWDEKVAAGIRNRHKRYNVYVEVSHAAKASYLAAHPPSPTTEPASPQVAVYDLTSTSTSINASSTRVTHSSSGSGSYVPPQHASTAYSTAYSTSPTAITTTTGGISTHPAVHMDLPSPAALATHTMPCPTYMATHPAPPTTYPPMHMTHAYYAYPPYGVPHATAPPPSLFPTSASHGAFHSAAHGPLGRKRRTPGSDSGVAEVVDLTDDIADVVIGRKRLCVV